MRAFVRIARIGKAPPANASVDHSLALACFDARSGENSTVIIEARLRAYVVNGALARCEHWARTVRQRRQGPMPLRKAGGSDQQFHWNPRQRPLVLRSQLNGITRRAATNTLAARHLHAAIAAQRLAGLYQPRPERAGGDVVAGFRRKWRRHSEWLRPAIKHNAGVVVERRQARYGSELSGTQARPSWKPMSGVLLMFCRFSVIAKVNRKLLRR